jgi:hypothetical protein
VPFELVKAVIQYSHTAFPRGASWPKGSNTVRPGL